MRECGCGCGVSIVGAPSKRFVDDAHRKRASRQSDNGHATADVPPVRSDTPALVRGRVRAGLEEWLADRPGLAGSVTSAARVLADQLDAAPDHSPLWGRYSTVLGQLVESARLTAAERQEESWWLHREIRSGCGVRGHAQALLHCAWCCGDQTRRCLAGEHAWPIHAGIGGVSFVCEHCGFYPERADPDRFR